MSYLPDEELQPIRERMLERDDKPGRTLSVVQREGNDESSIVVFATRNKEHAQLVERLIEQVMR